jgi:serralysin
MFAAVSLARFEPMESESPHHVAQGMFAGLYRLPTPNDVQEDDAPNLAPSDGTFAADLGKPVYTNSQIIQAITNTGGAKWTGTSWTYSFPAAAWFAGGEATGFSSLNASQKVVAQGWLQLWDDLIVPHFTNAGTSTTANVKLENSTTGPGYAYAYYPGATSTRAGSAWFNPAYNSTTGTNDLVTPQIGKWGYLAFGHELGHTLGLSHPGAYNGGSPTYATDAVYAQDSTMYTVMSYFDSSNTGADNIASDGKHYYPQTPMEDDILALQSLYGVDTTTRNGNTTYGFHSTAGNAVYDFTVNLHPIICIYDAGGADTLDFSGFRTACSINLTPGGFSNCDSMTYNVSIAFNTTIENAVGGTANDTLVGNSANNVLDGGLGADTMSGGLGSDTYYVDSVGDVVTELAGQGTDTVISTITYTLPDNVENLTLGGTNAINGTGNALNNVMTGNAVANILHGGAGNDILDGGAGADALYGGTGDDTYYVDNVGDQVIELSGEGTDKVISSVTYTLGGNAENLTLNGTAAINGNGNAADNVIVGNSAINILNGGAGNDALDGGTGADTMIGGLGNDTYYVDNALDVVTELAAQGTDTVISSIAYTLKANVENLTLSGSAALSGIGNELNNVITGNAGSNLLSGGAGNDILIGGPGKDTLTGGLGADVFKFLATADSVVGLNRDAVTDFSVAQGDKIDLSLIDANSILAGDQAFVFIGTGAFTHVAGQIHFQSAVVSGDVNGDGVADFEIQLTGVTTLTSASFIL